MFKCTKYYDGTFDQEKFDKDLLASTEQDGLMSKEDKAKLDGMTGSGATGAVGNTTVNASDVIEDGSHRFVTDDEKTTWNNQVSKDELGVANGVATLDDAGLIPTSQLPGFVDDVVEAEGVENFPATGESGKLYVDTTANKTYRWTGTQYTAIATDGLALGETSATAFAGDKGKAVTDSVNAIVDGTTIVPKANEAETVRGFTVGVNVPADAVFTDTVYTHPETHEATMIIETEDKKFATAAQLEKVDAIPEDPKYTDTVYEHPETHEATMIVEDDTHKFATAAQLEKVDMTPEFFGKPYYDEEENALFACGVPIVVTAVDDTKAKCEFTGTDNGKESFEFPMGNGKNGTKKVIIYGGGNGYKGIPFFPATCVTLNSGTFFDVVTGCLGIGSVGTGTIIVNGGNLQYIDALRASGKESVNNIVGHINIVVNNSDSQILCIFGGPQGLGTVGYTKLIINGGSAQYVTAGGSNGYTGEAEVVVNGGTIDVLQGCNRGAMGNIKLTLNDGTVKRMYAGGETEDSGVTATYEKSEVYVYGGVIAESISAGTNGGVENADKVSGLYATNIVDELAAKAMNLKKAPIVFTDIIKNDNQLIFSNNGQFVYTIEM